MKRAAIGIRREDKNHWERRSPLTPDHVAELVADHALDVRVQPSVRRVFPERDYTSAGATVTEELGECRVILGVKEIPIDTIMPGKTYACFAHVIKGQPANMPALRRFIELGCTLIDYEPIVDRRGRRLIFFGRHAGYAGMIDTLWALGQRLEAEGIYTPLSDLRLAHQYASLDEATDHVSRIGARIRHEGLPESLRPVAFAFTGSGNVSQGAQEVFDRLPFQEVDPEELPGLAGDADRPRNVLFKTVFQRRHRAERTIGGGYDDDEFREHPDHYQTALTRHLPHLTVLVNGVYWEPSMPKLVTTAAIEALFRGGPQPKLRVIGDITCDVGGSIEVNLHATDSSDPIYVYDVDTRAAKSGVMGNGPVILAVDNLPCELPREASEHFGDSLLRFVPPLARCDWDVSYGDLDLPEEILRATIVFRGELTPHFSYLKRFLETP